MANFDPYMIDEERKIKKLVLQDIIFEVGKDRVEEIEPYEESNDNENLWFAVAYPYNAIKKINGRYVVYVEYE